MRREASGALTVPCSIHGQSGRVLVETHASVTTFPTPFSNGSDAPPNRHGYRHNLSTGTTRQVSAAQISDQKIGDFKVPHRNSGGCVTTFRLAARRHENRGILGMNPCTSVTPSSISMA